MAGFLFESKAMLKFGRKEETSSRRAPNKLSPQPLPYLTAYAFLANTVECPQHPCLIKSFLHQDAASENCQRKNANSITLMEEGVDGGVKEQ